MRRPHDPRRSRPKFNAESYFSDRGWLHRRTVIALGFLLGSVATFGMTISSYRVGLYVMQFSHASNNDIGIIVIRRILTVLAWFILHFWGLFSRFRHKIFSLGFKSKDIGISWFSIMLRFRRRVLYSACFLAYRQAQ